MTKDLGQRIERVVNGPEVPRGSRTAEDPRRRFPIDVRQTALPRMSRIAWEAIAANNDPARLFLMGATPVRVIGGTRGRAVAVQELNVDALTGASARSAWWHKLVEDRGETEQFPLERVVRDMLVDPDVPLPRLGRVVRAPAFGPDGTLSLKPGYDPATTNYYAANGLEVVAPDPSPDAGAVEAAKALLLEEFLGDFPFTGDAERAHALACLLNPFVRDLIDGSTPMTLIEAPAAGTGKGLLAHMLMLPALDEPPLLMPPAGNEEETRKRITSALLGLPEAVLMDNVADGIDSPALAAALTATIWTDRVLGRSEARSIPVRCTWIATGNNPSQSREMARRVIRIRLDSAVERPEERSRFRHRRIERWALRHRGELVGAALTLVQAWVAQGMPEGEHVLGSFDAWASVHGGILDVTGVPGFLAGRTVHEAITVSDDAAWAAFTEVWWQRFGGSAVLASQLFPLARDIPEFPLGTAPSDRGQRTAFGRGLSRNRDRIFNGRQVRFAGEYHNAAQYRLVAVDDAGDAPF